MGSENAMQPIAFMLSTLVVATGHPTLQATPTTAIVGAKIEIGDGRTVENGTIVIQSGRIVSVGTGPAPAGATTINGKGLIVYPGFIDAYSTAGVTLPDPLPSGSPIPDTITTAPATMWHENRKNIRADVIVADHLSLKAPFTDRYRDGITSVLVSGGAGSLAGTAALVELAATPKVLVREAAEEIVFAGGGGRRGGDEMAGGQRRAPAADDTPTYAYPGTLFGVFGLMRQTLADAQFYAKQTPAPAKKEPTYAALTPLVTGRMPAMFTLTNAREIARAGHLADEFGFRIIVNGVPDAYRMIDVLRTKSAPVIVPLDLAAEPRRRRLDEEDTTPQRVLDDRYATYQERIANARLLDAAGIPIAFRSGLGGYLTKVRELVAKSGLPRASALRAMTINPARMFGVADRIGTVEVGKVADLVLMTGDFLDAKSTVKTVVGDGVATSPKEPTK